MSQNDTPGTLLFSIRNLTQQQVGALIELIRNSGTMAQVEPFVRQIREDVQQQIDVYQAHVAKQQAEAQAHQALIEQLLEEHHQNEAGKQREQEELDRLAEEAEQQRQLDGAADAIGEPAQAEQQPDPEIHILDFGPEPDDSAMRGILKDLAKNLCQRVRPDLLENGGRGFENAWAAFEADGFSRG